MKYKIESLGKTYKTNSTKQYLNWKRALVMIEYANLHQAYSDQAISDHFGYRTVKGYRDAVKQLGFKPKYKTIKCRMSKKQIVEICERYTKGESTSSIAESLGVSSSIVAYWMKKHGYSMKDHAFKKKAKIVKVDRPDWSNVLYGKTLGYAA